MPNLPFVFNANSQSLIKDRGRFTQFIESRVGLISFNIESKFYLTRSNQLGSINYLKLERYLD